MLTKYDNSKGRQLLNDMWRLGVMLKVLATRRDVSGSCHGKSTHPTTSRLTVPSRLFGHVISKRALRIIIILHCCSYHGHLPMAPSAHFWHALENPPP
jgi:hypothetical protein